MEKYLALAILFMPVVSFVSYWIGYNKGEEYGRDKGWNKGYAMGKKVMEMVARG